MAKRRGYSREHPATAAGGRYLLDGLPAWWPKVKAKAKREGVSIRALVLSLAHDWLERDSGLGRSPKS